MKKVFGMPLALAIMGLLVIGGATAALLQVYVFAAGTADVQQSVTWSDKTTEQTFSFDEVDSGSETLDVFTLQNNVGVEAEYEFETKCDTGSGIGGSYQQSTETDIDWNTGSKECAGLTTRYVEYFDDAGADLDSYTPPAAEDCNVNVTSSDSIQTAVDDASSGDVVCVEAGTYDEHVLINVPVTLASKDGQGEAVITEGVAVFSSDTTVTGFKINPYTGSSPNHDYAGVYVQGSLSNVLVTYNELAGSGSGKGVSFAIEGDYPGAVVENNKMYSLATGIYTNPHSGVIDIKYNDFDSGIGGAMGANVEYNVFADGTGIGVDEYHLNAGYDKRNLVIENNNFEGTAYIHNYDLSAYPESGEAQDALNNWWDVDGVNTDFDTSPGWIEGQADVNAGWMTKTDTTLGAGETDKFGVINTFAINLAPGDYTLKSNILPVVEE